MDRPEGPTPRDRILDAAEAVVVRQGIANLTLDAVAAQAGMSKGGLLHHFPNKDSLVQGMVSRCAEHWRAGVMEAYEAADPGPGRMARAQLSHLDDTQGWTEQCQQSSTAAFAALAQNPRLIEPMRAVYSELRERLSQDGLPPGVGETILVAMDGLWLNRVLGLAPVDRRRMETIHRTLRSLVDAAGSTTSPQPTAAERAGRPGSARTRPAGARTKK